MRIHPTIRLSTDKNRTWLYDTGGSDPKKEKIVDQYPFEGALVSTLDSLPVDTLSPSTVP